MRLLRGTIIVGATCAVLLATLAGSVGRAADEKTTPITPEQEAFFESKIRPLLISNCYNCHADGQQKADLRVDSREAMLKGNARGAVLIPGDPDKSRLLQAVHYDGAVKMPPAGKLKPLEIAALTQWIKMGAPWPAPKAGAHPGQAPDLTITPTMKQFWSFKPFKKPAVPKVTDAAWCITPIDRFVLAKLESKNLKPAPVADKHTLIRRVTFDLTGLPPTPEEVEAFVNDKSPNAWAKVVDRLLASPHYGERWGRHWLDVVRYADSNGLDENVAFAHAHYYRDYVVAALNKDKPYDQFVTEQLAGDLMPSDNDDIRNERITATGFLTLGPKVLAEPDKEKMVMDIVDEQIEVTSKAFMGLTVACARCHNHKFDPIPTKDYYALAGIFKSTQSMSSLNTVAMWQERQLDSKAIEAQKQAYAQKIKDAEAVARDARDKANAELLVGFRKDAAKYLKAGWELAQGELHPIADTPVQPGDPQRLIVEAENYNRGNANKDFQTYGKGIGIIHTVAVPTTAEWDVMLAGGNYQVDLRYTAQESRPLQLLINGKVVNDKAAGSVTGSWQPDGQRWEPQGVYTFNPGKNTISIRSNGSIPHIDKLLIVAAKPQPKGAPLRTPEQIAGQYGLNVAMVKQCAKLLASMRKDPSQLSNSDFTAEATRLAERMTPPEKADQFYAPAAKETVAKAEAALKMTRDNEPKPPMVMAVEEGKIANCKVHIRGDTQNLGDDVPRHFISVLDGDKVTIDDKHSGRLELAQWLTRPENPLTARVEINRMWQWHFGKGLVQTPDNYGLLGLKPSNPELLDWLAKTFIEQGWSAKKMHRLMLLSNTYKMSTIGDPKTTALAATADPENTFLWKRDLQRLDAEPFRDSILAVSGKLDLTMGGTLMTTNNHDYVTNDQSGNAGQYGSMRRSIYLPIIRNALFDMFQAFDYGDPSMVNAKRATTTVAPQALYVMNSPFVLEQSKAFATDLLANASLSDTARLKLAYMKAYSRPPTAAEISRFTSFMATYGSQLASVEPDATKRRLRTWAGVCQLLYASNEFIYIN